MLDRNLLLGQHAFQHRLAYRCPASCDAAAAPLDGAVAVFVRVAIDPRVRSDLTGRRSERVNRPLTLDSAFRGSAESAAQLEKGEPMFKRLIVSTLVCAAMIAISPASALAN